MNILIIEDHVALLEGVEHYLRSNHPEINNIYTASNGKDALLLLNGKITVDIVISDLNMPKVNGIDFIKLAKPRFPQLKIIILTMYYSKGLIEILKSLQIDAFLTKNASLSELSKAIKSVCNNTVYISPPIQILFNENQFEIDEDTIIMDNFSVIYSLSSRENDVLKCMVDNLTSPEMAEKLFLSTETIKSHRKNIYKKLGVNNVLDLYKLLTTNNYFKQHEN